MNDDWNSVASTRQQRAENRFVEVGVNDINLKLTAEPHDRWEFSRIVVAIGKDDNLAGNVDGHVSSAQ